MLHITTHSGKLHGMHSISTSVALNPICKERAKDTNTICSHCYASRYVGMRKGLRDKLELNTNALQSLIPFNELPVINDRVFRLESFGDVMSTTQAANYYRLAGFNYYTTFTAWTKNVAFYEDAHENIVDKPHNFILIYSDPLLNGHSDEWYEAFLAAHPLVDYIFVVMDKEHAAQVEITCGTRKCLECLHCYRKGNARIIREVLK